MSINQSRTYHLQVKLTPRDADRFKDAAHARGQTMSEFAREALGDAVRAPDAVPRAAIARDIAGTRAEFGRIGGNINQIARIANETKRIDTSALMTELDALKVGRAALSAAMADLRA